jgi:hypothetical protein
MYSSLWRCSNSGTSRHRPTFGRAIERGLVLVVDDARPRGEHLHERHLEIGGQIDDQPHHREVVLAFLHQRAREVRHALDGADLDAFSRAGRADLLSIARREVEGRGHRPLGFEGDPVESELPRLPDLFDG